MRVFKYPREYAGMLKIQAAQHTFGPQACKINAQDSHTKYLYMFINTHLTTATHPRYIHARAHMDTRTDREVGCFISS